MRLGTVVTSAAEAARAPRDAWVSVALTFQGLRALGVPQASLDSFASEFRQGMAARAEMLGDTGESGPANWEKPLGQPGRPRRGHGARAGPRRLDAALARARRHTRRSAASRRSGGRTATRCPPSTEPFGYRDGIGHPAIEGSGIPGTNPAGAAAQGGRVRARLPRRDRAASRRCRSREVLGRNGTYVVFRKLHQRVAAFRRYLQGERSGPGGRGAAGGQDDGALAQRRAARAVPAARRSRARRRSRTQQRLSSSSATIRSATRRRAARTSGA